MRTKHTCLACEGSDREYDGTCVTCGGLGYTDEAGQFYGYDDDDEEEAK